MTFRALDYGPPPDEQWVIIGYRSKRGAAKEIRLPWRLLEPGRADTAAQPGSRAQLKQATNPAAEAVRRAKKLLFAPHLWAAEAEPATASVPQQRAAADRRAAAGADLPTSFQDNLAARALTRDLGYLRIWSFDVGDDNAFLDEVTRLLRLLPQKGLVVDLRAQPRRPRLGGRADAAAVHRPPHRPDALPARGLTADAGDGGEPVQPDGARAVGGVARRRRVDRRAVRATVAAHRS